MVTTVQDMIDKLTALNAPDLPFRMAIGKGKKFPPCENPTIIQATNDQRRYWFDKHVDSTSEAIVLIQEID